MSAVVWCDLSATVCGAEYSGGMPAARVRAKDDGWVWTAWNERGKRLGLGGGYAKVGEAMAAAERQIDAAHAALSFDGARLTGPAEAAAAREAIEDAALAGAYERPRPRTSREVERAAPAPQPTEAPYYDPGTGRCPHGTRYPHECRDGCEDGPAPPPEPAAGRLPTPGDTAWIACKRCGSERHYDGARHAVLERDAAILARLGAALLAEANGGGYMGTPLVLALEALRAELRGGAT